MTATAIRLAFFKLNVPDMDDALAFYAKAFGFQSVQNFDEPDFVEHILALPGQEQGPNLMLVAYKDKRDVSVGQGHGPLGLVVDDIEKVSADAIAAGATVTVPIFPVAGVQVTILLDPTGHEIELVQPGAS